MDFYNLTPRTSFRTSLVSTVPYTIFVRRYPSCTPGERSARARAGCTVHTCTRVPTRESYTVLVQYVCNIDRVEGGDQRRDGCPNARHLFESNYVKVWTQKFGQRLSMACGVDFVLFKSLYVKITFIAMFLIYRHMSHSKLSAKRPLKTACYFSSNLSFSPWQSVGSTWSRQVPVLSARYEYLTVENPANLSSIRLVWQVSRLGAPFTEKKIETKIAAANAGCRNKMKAHQRKISEVASNFPQHFVSKKTEIWRKIIDDTLNFSAYFTCV